MTTLYLRKMGCDIREPKTDINNYRVRVIENIDINFKGEAYNMFFEFCHWDRTFWRFTNKRTGKELKKPVKDHFNHDAMCIDTQYERPETTASGYNFMASYRNSTLEKTEHEKNRNYTRADILAVINSYAIDKYSKVVFIEEEAEKITLKEGGYREKSILNNDPYFSPADTWNNDHKIVRVTERINHKSGNSYEVDLVTGKITN